ncbi:MAG: type II toxin-antitoxin system VapC family toxin [Comamonadaceae bacterium]
MSGTVRSLFVAEPPAQYLLHPPLVVDCSTLAGMVFSEHWRDQALQRIDGRSLHAPYLLDIEITSVALKKNRRGDPNLAVVGMQTYATMDIKLHAVKPQEVLALALRYQLSAYDASYLWLAAELKCPLATFDEKLATAAQTHLAALP